MKRFTITFIIGFIALIGSAEWIGEALYSFTSDYSGKTGDAIKTVARHYLSDDLEQAVNDLAEQGNLAACFMINSNYATWFHNYTDEKKNWFDIGLKLYEDSIKAGSPEIVFINQDFLIPNFKQLVGSSHPYSGYVVFHSMQEKMKEYNYYEKLKTRAEHGDSLAIWAYAISGLTQIINAYNENTYPINSSTLDSLYLDNLNVDSLELDSLYLDSLREVIEDAELPETVCPKADSLLSIYKPYFQKFAKEGNLAAILYLSTLFQDTIYTEQEITELCQQKANQGSFGAMFMASSFTHDSLWLTKAFESEVNIIFNFSRIEFLKENRPYFTNLEKRAKEGDRLSLLFLLKYYSQIDYLHGDEETDADSVEVDSTYYSRSYQMRDSVKYQYWADFTRNLIDKKIENGEKPDFVLMTSLSDIDIFSPKAQSYIKAQAESGDILCTAFMADIEKDENLKKYWKNKVYDIFRKYAEDGNESFLEKLVEHYCIKDSLSAEEKAQRNHWCEKAIDIYKSNIEKGCTENYKNIAELYDKCDNAATALLYWEKAVEQDSTDENSLFSLGKHYYQTGNYQKAVATLEKFLTCKSYVYDDEVYEELATCYEKGLGVKKNAKRAAELRKKLE